MRSSLGHSTGNDACRTESGLLNHSYSIQSASHNQKSTNFSFTTVQYFCPSGMSAPELFLFVSKLMPEVSTLQELSGLSSKLNLALVILYTFVLCQQCLSHRTGQHMILFLFFSLSGIECPCTPQTGIVHGVSSKNNNRDLYWNFISASSALQRHLIFPQRFYSSLSLVRNSCLFRKR